MEDKADDRKVGEDGKVDKDIYILAEDPYMSLRPIHKNPEKHYLKLEDITIERVRAAYEKCKKSPKIFVGENPFTCCPLEAIAFAEGYFHWSHILQEPDASGFIIGFDRGTEVTPAEKHGNQIAKELGIIHETKN